MVRRTVLAQALGFKLYPDSNLATSVASGSLEFYEWKSEDWVKVLHAPFDGLSFSELAKIHQAKTLDEVYLIIQSRSLSHQRTINSLRDQVDEAVNLLFSLAGRMAELAPEEGAALNQCILDLLSIKKMSWRGLYPADIAARHLAVVG